jgi:hypothetical protein
LPTAGNYGDNVPTVGNYSDNVPTQTAVTTSRAALSEHNSVNGCGERNRTVEAFSFWIVNRELVNRLNLFVGDFV